MFDLRKSRKCTPHLYGNGHDHRHGHSPSQPSDGEQQNALRDFLGTIAGRSGSGFSWSVCISNSTFKAMKRISKSSRI